MKSRRFMVFPPDVVYRFMDFRTLVSLVEVLRIYVLGRRDVLEQAFEVDFHRPPCGRGVMRFDRGEHGLVFDDHLGDPAKLGQGEPPIAVDMDLYLLDVFPDARIACDIGNGSMKSLVGLVKRIAVAGRAGLALALQDRLQRQDLAWRRAFGGEPRGRFLQRLADDDGLGECRDWNASDEDAGL